ncbi:transcription factor bHLH [Forsythia ovata]|uniref:Transcription factor bHLH n=1 Tax=Forsythia ovata TaxID=205694 RepID=A0ABD1V087_9LAMI
MKGYKDSVIPSLISDFTPLQGFCISEKGSDSRKSGINQSSATDTILKERGRREKMSDKYSLLRSMVPTLFTISKPTRERIVHDTVNYIKCLEEEIKRLEGIKKLQVQEPKAAKPVLSRFANQKSSIDVTVSSGATFFAIRLPFKPDIITKIVKVFDKHHAEVLVATVSVDEQQLLTFTVTIVLGSEGGNTIQKIKEEIVAL